MSVIKYETIENKLIKYAVNPKVFTEKGLYFDNV
jgi:hypothetical protein